MVPWTWVAPAPRKPLHHRLGDGVDLLGEAPPVGVAKDQGVGPAPEGGLEGGEGVSGILLVAVKEVLGVVDHPPAPPGEEGHRLLNHAEVLLQG